MKTITKRLTATLLCLLMALPTTIHAEEETHDHTHEETEITVTSEDVSLTETETPDPITEIEVTEESISATSGMIGESNVAWNLDTSTGHLTITGNGDCTPFTSADDQPWAEYREQITEVWFRDMETLSISDISYWFDGCTSLMTAEIPYTTSIIGERAFADCHSLETVMLYYTDQTFSIGENAFSTNELTTLDIRYILSSESTLEILAGYDWLGDNRRPSYTDVYGISLLASSYCYSCGVTCRYTLEYEEWGDTYHSVRWWCSNCGDDMNQGTNAERHEMEDGICIWCGYDDGSGSGGGDETCYHDYTDIDWYGCEWEEYCEDCGEVLDSGIDHGYIATDWNGCDWEEYCEDCGEVMDWGTDHGSTYTEWSGCDWYEYCNNCDELMDSGTSHGSYSYGAWEYYNSSRHRRLYGCSDCGEGSYDYGYHSTTTEYSQYNSTQHQKGSYCSTCSSYVGSTSYESHSFSYGSWSNYSSSQHRRTATCSTCGYSTYEYASHSLSSGYWTSTGSSQHKRTVNCSCGYSTTEYANHSLTYGSWTNYSSSQHRRTVSCSACGYSTYEYASHSITTGSWSSISDTQHSRTKSCFCGYSTTETAAHTLTYGSWASYNDTQHRRSATCSCGYSGYVYENHSHAVSEMNPKDDAQHTVVNTCTCRHTVEEAENHTFEYEDWTFYSETEHSRDFACDCGFSSTEYGEHEDGDGDDYCDSCDYLMSRFSVTVPATLNLTVSKDGTVYAATSAQIVNNSTDAVSVTSVNLTAENGWEIVPYSTNMANTKVDAKLIGFYLNGAESDGSGYLTLSNNWQIDKNDALDLAYDAVVSATSEPIDEQVLTVVFVIGWA